MSYQSTAGISNTVHSTVGFDNIPATELESMRLQLNKLISSLKNLQQQLMLPSVSLSNNGQPVISWSKLSERVEAAVNHLNKLQKNIIQFDSYNVYPNAGKFPVEEEELINVLLRKKHLPAIDDLYLDLLKISQQKIDEYKTENNMADKDEVEIIKKYFTANDALISMNLKLLKQTKKHLFDIKSKDEDSYMDVDDIIDVDNYQINSTMIPFDIETVYKFMYSGAKTGEEQQPEVIML
ncbi:hypothetical protein QEN19_002065 [Hanseniaspora menglaensis]